MLIVMNHNATQADVDAITQVVKDMGFRAEPIPGSERTAIGVLGNHGYVDDSKILEMSGVQRVIHVSKPYKLVSRDFHPEDTIVDVAGVKVGKGCRPVVVGGPCAVESEEQIVTTALFVKKCGASMLRGGAQKMWCQHAAGGGFQAAYRSPYLSGAAGRRLETAGDRRQRERPADCDRNHEPR